MVEADILYTLESMTKTIVITSGKGGVGKTNISVNTALELAKRQYRTCLLDADLGLANVNILFGIHPEKNLDDVLFRGMPLEEIIVQTEYGVDVIPGSSGVEKMANLDAAQLSGLVEGFAGLTGYDYFLIDTSSGISRGVVSFCLAATETILVLTAEATSLADAYAVLKVLSLNNYRGTVKILVNKCVSVPQAKKTYAHFKAVADKHLKIEIVPGGAVLADPLIEKAVSRQQPTIALFPDSVFSLCIRALVSNLVRSEPTEAQETDGESGLFWSRYVGFLQSDLLLPGEPKRQPEVIVDRVGTQPLLAKESDSAPEPPDAVQSLQHLQQDDGLCMTESSQLQVGLSAGMCLPSPLPLLSCILAMQASGQLTVAEMQNIISCDPALLGKALQIYRLSEPLEDHQTIRVDQLMKALGEDTLLKLLLTTASHGLLSSESVQDYSAVNEIWVHSYRCGLMAKGLARMIGYPYPEEAYLAGMLHDVGKLALLSRSEGMNAVSPASCIDENEIIEEEKTAVETTPSGLSAEVIAGWGLGSFIVDAARYHDETEARVATALDMTKLVYIAHKLCSPSEHEVSRAIDLAMHFFALPASQMFTCMQVAGKDLVKSAEKYGIPRRQDIPESEVAEIHRRFRRQAVEHVTLQSVLPFPHRARITSDKVRAVHQGLNMLFGMSKVICMLADEDQTYLQAEGYEGCYGDDFLGNVRFSIQSRRSLVVEAYLSGTFRTLTASDLESMADRQLLNVLQCDVLLCLPLVRPGTRIGLVVYGLPGSEHQCCKALQRKLEMFAAQTVATFLYDNH